MNKLTRSRVFYCGMINTNNYANRIDSSIVVAAAANKMTAVIQAIRQQGLRAFLVTMPVLGRFNKIRFASGLMIRGEKMPQIIFPTVANAYCRKILSMIYFGWFCLRVVKPGDIVILYNHALEYLLGLIVLCLRGIRPILDIEDIPRHDERGFFHWLDKQIFHFFMMFTSSKKIVVSNKLAKRLGVEDACIIHGSIRSDLEFKPSKKFLSSRLVKVIYSGTLIPETGLDLFCDSVKQLVNILSITNNRIEFVITGFGGVDRIEKLQAYCSGSNVQVTYKKTLTHSEYLNQIRSCDVGLCLKMPDSDITNTTFPSKVIEITTNGLLLISTKASDVPDLFDSSCAVFLSESTSNCLVNAFMKLFSNSEEMQKIAQLGQKNAFEQFSQNTIGLRLTKFISN